MINYNKSSKQLAVDLINQVLDSKVGINEVEFTDVTYLEEGYYNTRAVLKPALGSTWQDPVTIEYDRLNMVYFFKGIPIIIEPNYQRTLSDLLPVINKTYSLSLSRDDIIDGKIPEGTLPPYTLEIKINPTNPALYGSFRVVISNEDKSLKRKLSGVELGRIRYPTDDISKIQGPMYLRAIDFTEEKDTLLGYLRGDKVDERLVNLINRYTEDGWVNVNEMFDFNLFDSEIVYSGVNDTRLDYHTHPDYTHVLIIAINNAYCRNVSGYLTLHYNYSTLY